MPLFKIVKFKVKSQETQFRVNISDDGMFWCEPTKLMQDALKISRVEGNTFNEVRDELWNAVNSFNEINTKTEFSIMYKFHLSSRIKNQMPDALMDNQMWKKTSHSGGANQYYKDDIAININWYPAVTITLGESVETFKMSVVDENDAHYLHHYNVYKPFSELMFKQTDKIWDFYNEERYFNIALTAETFEFFSGIEGSFVSMITKMLSFLSQDRNKIEESISKILLSNSNFLLGS